MRTLRVVTNGWRVTSPPTDAQRNLALAHAGRRSSWVSAVAT